jgi:hypothetical protein
MTKQERILVLMDMYNHRPMSWPKFCKANSMPYTEPMTYVMTDSAPSFKKLRQLIHAFESIASLPEVAKMYRERIMEGDDQAYQKQLREDYERIRIQKISRKYEGVSIDPKELEEFKNRYFKIKKLHPFYISEQRQHSKNNNNQEHGNHQNN